MNMPFRANINKQRGVSFIEMMVTLAIFTVTTTAIATAIVFFYRTNGYILQQTQAIRDAQSGVALMVRDIRESAFSDDGAFPVIRMNANEFEFYSDTDLDNSIEKVKFWLDGENFYKVVTQPTGNPPVYDDAVSSATTTISLDIQNIPMAVDIFTYYYDDGTQIVNLADVTGLAFVEVNLIVNINPARLPNEYTLRSSATLRNLKINL